MDFNTIWCWGSTLKLLGEFTFGSYQFSTNAILHEAQTQFYQFSEEQMVIQKVCTLNEIWISLNFRTSI
jgi:hypothetical protein